MPLTQRNSLALPVGGPDWELRGGIGAGRARALWGLRRPGGGRCAPAALPGCAGGGVVRAAPRSSIQVRAGPRALVPPAPCRLPPSPGDFCRPRDCGRGRGVPAFGGAGAAGCAGARRRAPHPVPPPALPRLLPGADPPGFSALRPAPDLAESRSRRPRPGADNELMPRA